MKVKIRKVKGEWLVSCRIAIVTYPDWGSAVRAAVLLSEVPIAAQIG